MKTVKLLNIFAAGIVVGMLSVAIMIPKAENKAIFKPIHDTLTSDNVLYVLNKLNVQWPQIVLNQALLETGHFTSKVCLEKNNLFGLYDSANSEYFSFSHWVESCFAYKTMVQRKYKGGCYYTFLDKLPYAADPLYTRKLKYFRPLTNIYKNN